MPSPVTNWNRARRLACSSSHPRSVTGHGPAQAVMASHGPSPVVSASGEADTTARPVTVTGAPEASITWDGTRAGYTVAGAGGEARGGGGRRAGRARGQPGFAHAADRHQHDPVARAPAAGQHRVRHRFVPEHGLEPPRRPF